MAITLTPDEIAAARANLKIAGRQKMAASKPQAPTGMRGALLNFLPTVAGGAGAAVGTLAGPLGTIAGGSVGSGLGEYLRQKLSGEEQDGIDMGNIVQEGAFGALPGVMKGLKGLKGAKAATKTAQTTEASLLQKAGQKLSQEGAGIKVPKNVHGATEAARKGQTATQFVGTPKQQLGKMEKEIGRLADARKQVLKNSDAPINGGHANQRMTAALDDPSVYVDLDLDTPSARRTLQNIQAKFATAKSPAEIEDLWTSGYSKHAARATQKLKEGKNLTQAENAILAAKRSVDDTLNQIEGVAPLTQEMAKIYDLAPDVATAANKSWRVPFIGANLKAPVQAMKGAQSVSGRLLQGMGIGAGESTAAKGFRPFLSTAGASIPQAGYRGAASLVTGMPFVGKQEQPSMEDIGEVDPYLGNTPPELSPEEVADTSSPFSLENIEANAQKILANGGTMEDVQKYVSLAKTMSELTPKSKSLNSAASGVVADTKTGLESLSQLSGEITASGANNPLIGRLRGSNPLDTDAQGLKASVATAKQIVGKALEGGVLRKEDEIKYTRLLPTMGDTDAVAQDKINKLINLIGTRLNEYQNSLGVGNGGADLSGLTGAAL